jgi:hypothetical protein
MLPAAVGLALFAARGAALGWQSGKTWIRAPVVVASVYAIGLGLLQGIDLTYQMVRDSRFAAGAWLTEHAATGTRIEFFGADQKLPPIPAFVVSERATQYLGMFRQTPTDSVKFQEIIHSWEVRNPHFILVIPDHTSRADQPYDNTMPPLLYQALMKGDLRYRLAAHFKTPSLFPMLAPAPLDYPVVNPPIRVFATE